MKEITVRKNAEENLKNSRERLKTATSILRHDIKNDLVVIKSAVSIYRKGLDESMLDEIEKRVKKSLNIINNNHEQEAFIDSNAELGDYDLREAISVVVKNYPDLEINISGDGKVSADIALYSVFENIISNALKHGEATKLDIDIKCDKGFCEIRFADFGTGVPDKIKDRIFEEGFIYGKKGHTGIGLFITKQTVESYGGKIYVENNDPTGAVFVINLRSVV